MGDSDDDYNGSTNVKRNRDKFHRERDDSSANFNNNRNERRDWSGNSDRKDSNWRNKAPGMNINPNYPSSAGVPYLNQRNTDHGQRRFPNSNSYDTSPPHKKNKKEWYVPLPTVFDHFDWTVAVS
jgi:hypothetical protein